MGKTKHVNDFTVDTNNQCFFCIQRISRGFPSRKSEGTKSDCPSVHYSLQYLSRYLMLDMRKMFHEEDSIPPHLLAQVQKSRLKVELCEDCGRTNETFSKQYKQLEKIEMEVKSSLELIHRKFQAAMETNKTAQFQNFNVDANDFNGKMEIANALRTEAMGKCKRKLGRPSPLIRIHRMPKIQVMANQLRSKMISRYRFSAPNPKQSEISIRGSNPNDVDEHEHDYFDDTHSNLHTSDFDVEDPESETNAFGQPQTSKSSMQVIVHRSFVDVPRIAGAPNAVEAVEEKQYTINPETGKFKCNICSMEFGNSGVGFRYHYKSIHLGIKYKCNLCEKEFSQRPNYNTHHKKFHKDMPSSFSMVTGSEPSTRENAGGSFHPITGSIKCDLCPMEFESANELQDHYSRSHPDVKYRCKFCYNEFSQFSAYQQHVCNRPGE